MFCMGSDKNGRWSLLQKLYQGNGRWQLVIGAIVLGRRWDVSGLQWAKKSVDASFGENCLIEAYTFSRATIPIT